jgi:hypothetical protein
MRLSRRLKEGNVGRKRTSSGRLFQASMFLYKISEISWSEEFNDFFMIVLLQRKLASGVYMVNTVSGSKGVRPLNTL